MKIVIAVIGVHTSINKYEQRVDILLEGICTNVKKKYTKSALNYVIVTFAF